MARKDVEKTKNQWDFLSSNGVLFSRPYQEMTTEEASLCFPNLHFYGSNLKDKNVLCLASGGGQQSIAFALLGANVTVVDFSKEQLKKETTAAELHNVKLRLLNSDMRDLSDLKDDEFDIVYQSYSINYIPSIDELFEEVSRVIKKDGIYDLMFHNPFVHGSWKDGCFGNEWKKSELWKEKGYPIWQPYIDGHPIKTDDPHWNFIDTEQRPIKIESPQEYKHTLSTIVNGLIKRNFNVLSISEEVGQENNAQIGTWDHYVRVAPPWLYIVLKKV